MSTRPIIALRCLMMSRAQHTAAKGQLDPVTNGVDHCEPLDRAARQASKIRSSSSTFLQSSAAAACLNALRNSFVTRKFNGFVRSLVGLRAFFGASGATDVAEGALDEAALAPAELV